MATLQQDLAAIRTAVYGKDVREAIADGLSKITDISMLVSSGTTKIDNTDDDYLLTIVQGSPDEA